MKCNFEWLSAYLDGVLPDSRRAELEKHLKTCEACAAKLDELARLEAAAKKIPVPKLSEAYWENFASRVQNKITIRDKQKSTQPWLENLKSFFQPTTGKLALAGSLATILLVAIIGQDYWKKGTYQPPVFDGQKIKSAVGLNDTLQKPALPEEKERQVDADKRTLAAGERQDEPVLQKNARENDQKGLLAPPASAVASKLAEEAAFRSALKDEKTNEADLIEGRVQERTVEENAPIPAGQSTQGDTVAATAENKSEIRKAVVISSIKSATKETRKQSTQSDDTVSANQTKGTAKENETLISKHKGKNTRNDRGDITLHGIKHTFVTNEKGDTIAVESQPFFMDEETTRVQSKIAPLPQETIKKPTAMPSIEVTQAISDIRQILAEKEKELRGNPFKKEAESLYIYLAQHYVQLYRFSREEDDWDKANKRLSVFLKAELSDSARRWLLAIQAELKKIKK